MLLVPAERKVMNSSNLPTSSGFGSRISSSAVKGACRLLKRFSLVSESLSLKEPIFVQSCEFHLLYNAKTGVYGMQWTRMALKTTSLNLVLHLSSLSRSDKLIRVNADVDESG